MTVGSCGAEGTVIWAINVNLAVPLIDDSADDTGNVM